MNTSNTIETLLSLSLNQLCQTMNEDTLQYVLKSSTPSICIQIIWKVLGFDEYAAHLFNPRFNPVELGYEIAQMDLESPQGFISAELFDQEIFEHFATKQQIIFVDRFNCSSLFDHRLFFKLVRETSLRNHLFFLFRICIQIRGFDFPSNFAQEWVNMEKPDSNEGMCLPDIENGLKLGIFLGDAGWLNESALVLSHTYEIITTKWVCHDEIVELFKTLQCLTKWLLVASNYYNFVEAKEVLQNLIYTIDIIEELEERTLSISYSYLAVSQYYYVLLEFDKAWSWAVKAMHELHMASRKLKILILSHSIRLCSALGKLITGQKLRKQLNALNEDITDGYMYHDFLLSYAYYFSNLNTPDDNINWFYGLLTTARNLFGYYNLNTAIILTNYAFERHENVELESDESMRCILQAIFIMQKIGVPNDHMLLMNAHLIKSLLIQEIIFGLGQQNAIIYFNTRDGTEGINENETINQMKQLLVEIVEVACINTLHVASHRLGENNLLTAKTYSFLASIYLLQEKYTESEEMCLKEIEIIKSILGTNNAQFANSIGHLAHLYTHYLHKFQESELLLLQTINIYENITDGPIYELRASIEELIYTYKEFNNLERLNYYINYLATFDATFQNWCHCAWQSEISEENCTKIDLSLEKFKCILNGCSCGQ
ncbi:amyloid protein-binding protein 2-like [Acyrthosiphon pisum]|uniref:Uncharacterized protein n=1 Tax=Acyrthosiphon pisum TaxID=7029 RepID=A0A8R2H2C9_ACYPI|nr:amyloid protein-binding protein 2-like [Acyrthosiphon pisum]|eukprot:XP_016656194.1 PREDICTED: amyloid protein-binding protein 2-like isoform X1 [Acyrthosiphon pisum]